MNTPNKLTILRILLAPVFIFFLMMSSIPHNYFIALAVFIFACITDGLDGYLARKNNIITTFGKFLDPLADKVLVLSALICFIELGFTAAVPVIIIITREFLVTSVRLVASESGNVIAASTWGKIKTVVTMVAIMIILFMQGLISAFGEAVLLGLNSNLFYDIMMWIVVLVTLISGIEYAVKNWSSINHTK